MIIDKYGLLQVHPLSTQALAFQPLLTQIGLGMFPHNYSPYEELKPELPMVGYTDQRERGFIGLPDTSLGYTYHLTCLQETPAGVQTLHKWSISSEKRLSPKELDDTVDQLMADRSNPCFPHWGIVELAGVDVKLKELVQ